MPKKQIMRLGLVILILSIMVLGYGGLCKKDKDDDVVATGSSAPVPLAPSALWVSTTSGPPPGGALWLRWTDNSNDEGCFAIERGSTESGPFVEIGTVSQNETQYIDDLLPIGNTYYYRVRARNSYGNSGYSNVAFNTVQ